MLKLVGEIIQIVLELLGILLVAAGLGVLAAWSYGLAGFLTISGVTVLGAAYLYERRLRPPVKRIAPLAAEVPPPVTRSRPSEADVPAQVIERTWWRFGWLSTGRPAQSRPVVGLTWGRLAWLHDPDMHPP